MHHIECLKNRKSRFTRYDVFEDDVKAWADSGLTQIDDSIVHKDSNGVILQAGDTVTIIKDLEVKGAGFTAKEEQL